MRVGDLVRLSDEALAGGYDNDPESASAIGLVVAMSQRTGIHVYWGPEIGLHTEYRSDIETVQQYKPIYGVNINNVQRRLDEGKRLVKELKLLRS